MPGIPLAPNRAALIICDMELVIVLLLAGAILMLAETILPGMVAGIIGMICLIAGVIQSYIVFGPATGNLILLGVVVSLVVGTMLWLKFFPDTKFARVFISHQTVGDIKTERPALLDQTGTALSNLRPCGTALINGQRIDVVTEGAMIERGAPLKVVAVEGMRVVVRQCDPAELSSETETQTPNV